MSDVSRRIAFSRVEIATSARCSRCRAVEVHVPLREHREHLARAHEPRRLDEVALRRRRRGVRARPACRAARTTRRSGWPPAAASSRSRRTRPCPTTIAAAASPTEPAEPPPPPVSCRGEAHLGDAEPLCEQRRVEAHAVEREAVDVVDREARRRRARRASPCPPAPSAVCGSDRPRR